MYNDVTSWKLFQSSKKWDKWQNHVIFQRCVYTKKEIWEGMEIPEELGENQKITSETYVAMKAKKEDKGYTL